MKAQPRIPRGSLSGGQFAATVHEEASAALNNPDQERLDVLGWQAYTEAERVATLGDWPSTADPAKLADRIPGTLGQQAEGFDAGVACALDLIPREHQQLAARLHAAYTPDAVHQVRQELADLDADSDTCWWLAGCSVCREGHVTGAGFLTQFDEFAELRNDPDKRLAAALATADQMFQSFKVDATGVAHATRDGGMQGAYLAGHELAVHTVDDINIRFVGTYHASLGLGDSFEWQDPERSGPVNGSAQFVKCASDIELQRVLTAICVSD